MEKLRKFILKLKTGSLIDNNLMDKFKISSHNYLKVIHDLEKLGKLKACYVVACDNCKTLNDKIVYNDFSEIPQRQLCCGKIITLNEVYTIYRRLNK